MDRDRATARNKLEEAAKLLAASWVRDEDIDKAERLAVEAIDDLRIHREVQREEKYQLDRDLALSAVRLQYDR